MSDKSFDDNPKVYIRRKILYIDDDEIQIAVIKNMLETEYSVLAAKSGKEAIDFLLQGFVPDLVLLDIVMPQMDGWHTYNRIRSISLLKEVPIIFLTSVDDKSQEKHAFDIGAADYIRKPCEREDLLCRIKTNIEGFINV
jgi:PleD family two-component response regulator